MAQISLYVNSTDGLGTWTRVGTTPYLDTQNQPTSYVHSATRNANSDVFGFEDSADLGTINWVRLYIYAVRGAAATDFTTYLNSTNTGLQPPAAWGWVYVDVTSVISTWAAINSATCYFDKPSTTNDPSVDAAYLLVDYTAGPTPKSLDGSFSPGAGSTTKLSKTSPKASLTPTGTSAKLRPINLVGTFTNAAQLLVSKVSLKSLAAGLSYAGTVSRLPLKKLWAGIQPVGSIARKIATAVLAVLSLSGKLVGKALTILQGAVQFTGGAVRSLTTALAGIVGTIGSLVTEYLPAGGGYIEYARITIQVGKTVTASWASLASLATEKISGVILKALDAVLSMSGTAARKTSTAIQAGMSFLGTVARKSAHALSAAMQYTGTVARLPIKAVSGAMASGGVVMRLTLKKLAAGWLASGTLGRLRGRLLSASLAFTGIVRKTIGTHLTAALSTIGQLSYSVAGKIYKTVESALTFAGAVTKKSTWRIAATLSFIGTVVKRFPKAVAASLSFTGAIIRLGKKVLVAGLSFPGRVIKATQRAIEAGLAAVGTLARLTINYLVGGLGGAGAIIRQISTDVASGLGFSAVLDAIKSLFRVFYVSLDASLNFAVSLRKSISKACTAAFNWLATLAVRIVYLFRREFPVIVLYVDDLEPVQALAGLEDIVLFVDVLEDINTLVGMDDMVLYCADDWEIAANG